MEFKLLNVSCFFLGFKPESGLREQQPVSSNCQTFPRLVFAKIALSVESLIRRSQESDVGIQQAGSTGYFIQVYQEMSHRSAALD